MRPREAEARGGKWRSVRWLGEEEISCEEGPSARSSTKAWGREGTRLC